MKRIIFDTILQLQNYFAEMSAKEQAIYCVILQESNNQDFCQFGLNMAKNVTEEQIIANFVPLIELKASCCQAVRDLTGNLLDRVPANKLAERFFDLIDTLHSPFYFIREESLLLLNKIKPESLVDQFEYLRKLEKLEEVEGNFDIIRMAKSLLLKIVKVWNIDQKVENYNYAVELQTSTDKEAKSVGSLLVLQVMETWETEKLKTFLLFFIGHTDTEKNEFEVSEIASFLALKVLLASDMATRIINLNYITGFNYYCNKIIRGLFRSFALETMAFIDEEYLPNYALFLLQCLECKSKFDRKTAREFLKKINPDQLPVEDLLYFQASSLWRVRWACKKFAHKISEDILFDNLEIFIDLQKSVTPSIRHLASQLAASISVERLRLKKDLLQDCTKSRDVFVVDLAEALLYLI